MQREQDRLMGAVVGGVLRVTGLLVLAFLAIQAARLLGWWM